MNVVGNVNVTGNVSLGDGSTMITAFLPKGYLQRSNFVFNNSFSINLSAGVYEANSELYEWDSTLEFEFNANGSNLDSSDLEVSDWFYVYLDDSAIATAGTNILTVSEIVAVTTEPVWSNSKHGWYNGEDRCIFAVRTDASSHILEFFHEDDFVVFANYITDLVETDIDTTWVDLTLTIPKFSIRAQAMFFSSYIDGAALILYWRTNGQTGTTGHYVHYLSGDSVIEISNFVVVTDSTQTIEIKYSVSSGTTVRIFTNGWLFPGGM